MLAEGLWNFEICELSDAYLQYHLSWYSSSKLSQCHSFLGAWSGIQSRQSFWSFWGRGQKEDMETERAKSVGASPSSSPRKWKEEVRERKDSEEVPNEKGGGVKYNGSKDADLGVKPLRRDSEEGVISSDEEMDEVRNTVRPRQRSLKRKKTGFTNNLTSEQLVRGGCTGCNGYVCMYVCTLSCPLFLLGELVS